MFQKLDRIFIGLLCGFLLGVVIYHYYWAIGQIPPIHDASNCVSRTSNLGVLLSQGRFQGAISAALADKNNFFSLIYFSFFNLLFGPGRAAWAWGWLAGLACVALIILRKTKADERNSIVVALVLTLLSSSVFYRVGGVLDQRFDALAVLFLVLVVYFIKIGDFKAALLFSLTAVFSKGPALPIVGVLWFGAFFFGLVKIENLKRGIKQRPFLNGIIFLSIVVYISIFLRPVISYNLMAVKTDSSDFASKIGRIFTTLSQEYAVYWSWIMERNPFILVVVLLALGTLAIPKIRDFGWVFFSFFLFIATYILFTIHPVKADGLIIWLAPGIWAMAMPASQLLTRTRRAGVFSLLAIFLAVTVYMNNYQSRRFDLKDYEVADLQYIKSLSSEFAGQIVGAKRKPSSTVILVNFLFSRSAILGFNYDAIRVLSFELLGRLAPTIEGWELGTYSDDWRSELERFPKTDMFFTVVSEDVSNKVHPFGRGHQIAKDFSAPSLSACAIVSNVEPVRPDISPSKLFVFGEDFRCFEK